MDQVWSERPIPEEHTHLLNGVAEEFIFNTDNAAEIPARLAAAEVKGIVAGGRTQFNDAFFSQVPSLKVVARTGIGIDTISLADATANGVAICNTPDAPTVPTAEHAITLMLATLRHLKRWQQVLPNGERSNYFSMYSGVEFDGLPVGVVGLGRIGSRVAMICKAIGMQVMGYDPFVGEERARELGIEHIAAFEDLLPRSQVLTLHLPATAETRHLINAETLALMPSGSFLINAARGALVDETALYEALKSEHLHGAGLDVFDPEPPPVDNPLLHLDNVIATPHIASSTPQGKARMWSGAVEQVVQVLQGQRPPHLLNPDVWDQIQNG